MIYRSQANCSMCARYQGEQRCLAFPDGIPQPLWSGKNLHRDPYPGDGGFQYQPKRTEALALEDILPDAIQPATRHAATLLEFPSLPPLPPD